MSGLYRFFPGFYFLGNRMKKLFGLLRRFFFFHGSFVHSRLGQGSWTIVSSSFTTRRKLFQLSETFFYTELRIPLRIAEAKEIYLSLCRASRN